MRKREKERIKKELLKRKQELLGQALDPRDSDLRSEREDLLDSGDVASQEVTQSFKIRLREQLGVSKNTADALTSQLCAEGGPARRWKKKTFPAQHFVGLAEHSPQSSREDCKEDREACLHQSSLPPSKAGGVDRQEPGGP